MLRPTALLLCTVFLAAAAQNTPVYLDPQAPLESRVRDLVGRMTLEEKISQMMNDAPAIPRLGIPAYNWWNESLHGVARAGKATSFPEPIGLAATFDESLVSQMAVAISDEARAKFHDSERRGQRGIYQGLTFWSPNLNIFRDPRWGRGMETYGEDPYLTGRLGAAFIRGMQGDDPKYLKTIATAKHFAVHSGPESQRNVFDARVTDHDLFDMYLPQFEAAVVKGGAASVMCSYNRIDGQPACSNTRLLSGILREGWKFGGYVVSDCGAVSNIFRTHKVAGSAPEAAALAVKAGTDLDCGGEYRALLPAVQQKLIAEVDIDRAVSRLFTARFRLGLFDPPESVPYTNLSYDVVESAEHRDLALDAARKSIVLLKNEGKLLPLSRDLKNIAVIGPNANLGETMLGNYNGSPAQITTPLEGIRLRVSRKAKVVYAQGADLAEGLPSFEVVPATALFTGNSRTRKSGLVGQYFASEQLPPPVPATSIRKRAKAAVAPGFRPTFTHTDDRIDFRWDGQAPQAGLPDDRFSVRWSGFLEAPATGTYQLGAMGLNSFEVFLDGKSIARHSGIHEPGYASSPVALQAGKLYAIRVDYQQSRANSEIHLVWSPPHPNLEQEAVAAARAADQVILFLGLSPRLEGEQMNVPVEGFSGGDRVSLDLPKTQQKLLEAVVATGKPAVLVLLNGSALAIGWARDHVPAIVESWYPGQAGGAAIADVLFGAFNPAGRLPVTFYQSAQQLPPFDDYSVKGRTYRYFTGEPLYPFGYGLSFTSFVYRNLQFPREVQAGAAVTVSADVLNNGDSAGEEVIQLYVTRNGVPGAPVRSLAGFFRTRLEPGESKTVEFQVPPEQLALVNESGKRVVAPGSIEISVGGEQPGFSGVTHASTTQVLTGTLRLTGTSQTLN